MTITINKLATSLLSEDALKDNIWINRIESGRVLSGTEQKLLDKLKGLYSNYEGGEAYDKILMECIKLVEEI